MSAIIREKELKESLSIGRRPALINYLVEKNIAFEITPKGEVWTVQKAIDDAILNSHNHQHDMWEFPDV